MEQAWRIESPVGALLLFGTEDALTQLSPAAHCAQSTVPLVKTPLFTEAQKQLEDYFCGKRKDFQLPLAPQGTAFQLAVWKALQTIPYGVTWSYRQLAQAVENPNAYRAAGNANGKNPLMIFIPCHRVIHQSGGIGGYSGGLDIKRHLLRLEGSFPASGAPH